MIPTKPIHLPTKLHVPGSKTKDSPNMKSKTPNDQLSVSKKKGLTPNQEMVNNPKVKKYAVYELATHPQLFELPVINCCPSDYCLYGTLDHILLFWNLTHHMCIGICI